MGIIKFTQYGDFSNTERFFNKLLNRDYLNVLSKYGQQGVAALASATPKRSGKTASSWFYTITYDRDTTEISFLNSNINKGVNIAIILQYGHGTRNGGYVRGINYIDPAIQPIFEKMADEAWKEVVDA